jgi:hypothetical protein
VPPAPFRELQDLTRYRKVLIQERTRHANRLHKVLEDAGIKLAAVASRLAEGAFAKCLELWWAGTGLNRRHQDFQFSAVMGPIVRNFNDLLTREPIRTVTVSCGLLAPVTAIE